MGSSEERMGVESLMALERAQPSEEFAAELDARVAEGFPREPALARLLPSARFRPGPALVGATALVAAAVIGVSASGVLDSEPQPTLRDVEPASPAAPGRAAETGSDAGTNAGSAKLDKPRGRKVARTADLALSTAPQELRDVADRVVDVTHRYDGFVARSNVSSGDAPGAGAEFDLELPARDLQPALDDLSGLAHVSSLTEGTDDITKRFTTGRDRVDELTKQRERLRARLAEAANGDQEAALRTRLRAGRAELDAVRADLARAAQRVRFVPVHVAIATDGADADTGWGVGDALDDALGVLETALGVTLVILAILIPVALVAGGAGLGTRAWRNRRRESTLDGPA